MSDQSDPLSDRQSDDRIKPWTIKGISPEARNAAIAAAERARQPIGEWVSRAIRSQVQSDRQESRAPVPVLPQSTPASDPAVDLAQLERLVALTTSLSVAGAPPPKVVSRSAYILIRQRLAEMRGPTEPRPGPTKSGDSPTETPPGQTEPASGLTEAVSSLTETATGRTEITSGQTEAASGRTEPLLGQTKPLSSPTKPLPDQTETSSSQTEAPFGQTEAPPGRTKAPSSRTRKSAA